MPVHPAIQLELAAFDKAIEDLLADVGVNVEYVAKLLAGAELEEAV